MSKPEMRSDRLREELAEVKRQRDELRAALEAIVELDDGDAPALWAFSDRFDAARAALKSTEAP